MLNTDLLGKRKRGRPRKRYVDGIKECMMVTGLRKKGVR